MHLFIVLMLLKMYIFILSIRSNSVDKEVKKRGGGFNKVCSLSPQLQKLLGVSELARTQVNLFYLYVDPSSLTQVRMEYLD